jgi:hypothetical protein
MNGWADKRVRVTVEDCMIEEYIRGTTWDMVYLAPAGWLS